MFLSPEVAIVQHATGVMQVSWDYFENVHFFPSLVLQNLVTYITCLGHHIFH
jgi:hypothetical protein